MNREELRKILRGKCVTDEACEAAIDELFNLHSVSRRYTIEDIERCVENWGLCKVEKEHIERFLNGKYEVKWLINNTYQVEQNGNCVYQGSESDCNEWLKCQLGYCG